MAHTHLSRIKIARGVSTRIHCPDGRHILTSVHSSGDDVTCLVLRGFMEGDYVWNPVLARSFLASHRQLTMDLPGHGESSWETVQSYDRDTLVADIVHLAGARGLSCLILVGYSLSGRLAIRGTAQHGRLVMALVVVDTAPRASPIARKHLLAALQDNVMP